LVDLEKKKIREKKEDNLTLDNPNSFAQQNKAIIRKQDVNRYSRRLVYHLKKFAYARSEEEPRGK
jgi:hypothetical protein